MDRTQHDKQQGNLKLVHRQSFVLMWDAYKLLAEEAAGVGRLKLNISIA